MSILVGLVTIYTSVHGGPLYCDNGRGLVYAEDTPAWVAVDVREYQSGNVQCGDKLLIIGDGWELEVRAWDAGYLYRYYIQDYGPDVKIVADIPQFLSPFDGMCAEAVVINLSRMERWKLNKVEHVQIPNARSYIEGLSVPSVTTKAGGRGQR